MKKGGKNREEATGWRRLYNGFRYTNYTNCPKTKNPHQGGFSESTDFADVFGGGSGIRTLGRLTPSSVFKTGCQWPETLATKGLQRACIIKTLYTLVKRVSYTGFFMGFGYTSLLVCHVKTYGAVHRISLRPGIT